MNSIKANVLYTGKEILKNKYLVFKNEFVIGISDTAEGTVLQECDHIVPAFIDPHSHIGMIRHGEPSAESEANDQMDSIIPAADALDSVQMDDKAFKDSLENGVLYSCVLPGSGNILSGRAVLIKNYEKSSSDAFIQYSGVKAAFGYNPMGTSSWKGTRPYTRMGALALLRQKLVSVRNKMQKEEEALNADERILAAILKKEERLRVHVHKIDDIEALLRMQDEFAFDVTIEHACDVHSVDIYKKLASRKIPVVYGPLDSLAYKTELKHEDWRNVKLLMESGVDFALMTDHPVIMQNTLLLTLRHFLHCGMSQKDAIELITRRNAEILKADSFLGTLETGKWASFSCWDGDVFHLGSKICSVYAEGRCVYTGE